MSRPIHPTDSPDAGNHDAVQITTQAQSEASPLWSPEGSQLIYRSNRGSRGNQLFRVATRDVGRAELVLDDAQQRKLQIGPVQTDWSPDGGHVVRCRARTASACS